MFIVGSYDRFFAERPVTTLVMTEAANQLATDTYPTVAFRPFIYDGCTLIPEHFFGVDLNAACLAHDVSYWLGGTNAERLKADQQLRNGIIAEARFLTPFAWLAYGFVHFLGDTWAAEQTGRRWGHGRI